MKVKKIKKELTQAILLLEAAMKQSGPQKKERMLGAISLAQGRLDKANTLIESSITN